MRQQKNLFSKLTLMLKRVSQKENKKNYSWCLFKNPDAY